jgi:hypothetical protein
MQDMLQANQAAAQSVKNSGRDGMTSHMTWQRLVQVNTAGAADDGRQRVACDGKLLLDGGM